MAVSERNAASEHVQKESTILYSVIFVDNSYATLHVWLAAHPDYGLFCLCTDCLSTMNHFCPTAHKKINLSLAHRGYALVQSLLHALKHPPPPNP